MKRLLSLLLIFALVFFLVPGVHAEESEHTMLAQTQLEAIDFVRSMLVQRAEEVTLKLPVALYYGGILDEIYQNAVLHTGNAMEGESLLWQSIPGECYAEIRAGYAYLHFSFTYLTTAQEEAELDAAMDALLEELNCIPNDRYGSVKRIYDWVCANVSLSFEGDYCHTAYGAMIHREASDQGFALLMYKLLTKLGINCRILGGARNGETAVWNIVAVDSSYHYLDAAGDAGRTNYLYFLKGENTFPDHILALNYTEWEFRSNHSMAQDNYTPETYQCDTVGHNWWPGSCVKPNYCGICGVSSEEYGNHVFAGDVSCEDPRVCSLCGELVPPSAHSYYENIPMSCEYCSHSRHIVCLGDPLTLHIPKSNENDTLQLTLPAGVTAEKNSEDAFSCGFTFSFTETGRFEIPVMVGDQETVYDIHVFRHEYNGFSIFCEHCNKVDNTQHIHTQQYATCWESGFCTECGEILSEPMEHIFGNTQCMTEQAKCIYCGFALERELGHYYRTENATVCAWCYQPRVFGCTQGGAVIRQVSASADGFRLVDSDPGIVMSVKKYFVDGFLHCWDYELKAAQVGTYEVVFEEVSTGYRNAVTLEVSSHSFEEGLCKLCFQTDGTIHMHDWKEATCTSPKTCTGCGLSEGFPLNHVTTDGPCDESRSCINCGLVIEAPSHYYDSYTDPDCNYCGRNRYVACGGTGIDMILTSIEGGDFSLKNDEGGLSLSLVQFFMAEGISYWEYIITTPEAGQYEVILGQEGSEETLDMTLYVYDHEFYEGICLICGMEEETHVHTWKSATCEKAAECTQCGESYGEPLNHDFSGKACSESAQCARCGQSRGKESHSYDDRYDAHCNICYQQRVRVCGDEKLFISVFSEKKGGFRLKSPSDITMKDEGYDQINGGYQYYYSLKFSQTGTFEVVLEDLSGGDPVRFTAEKKQHEYEDGSCIYCDKIAPNVHVHDWQDSTCTKPAYCSGCGETRGEARGHSFTEANCLDPETCYGCGLTKGKALGHDFVTFSCTDPDVCRRCNALREKTGSHSYGNTGDTTCSLCGRIRATGCLQEGATVRFTADTDKPFVLTGSDREVTMTLVDCLQEGDVWVHTYRVSASKAGTYELTVAQAGETVQEFFSLQILPHNGNCSHCGTESQGIPGDVDGNGVLNYNDALMILRYSIQLETLDQVQQVLADADGNGKVDYNDALLVLRTSIGLV